MFAVTDREAIAQAYRQFAQLISQGGATVHRMVGYKGASEPGDLRWHADFGMWVLLLPERIDNRYWCAFGVDDPYPASMLSTAARRIGKLSACLRERAEEVPSWGY